MHALVKLEPFIKTSLRRFMGGTRSFIPSAATRICVFYPSQKLPVTTAVESQVSPTSFRKWLVLILFILPAGCYGCEESEKPSYATYPTFDAGFFSHPFENSPILRDRPSICGNAVLEPGEQCDGRDLGGATCAALNGPGSTGTVGCSSDCMYVTSQCYSLMEPDSGIVDTTVKPIDFDDLEDEEDAGTDMETRTAVTGNCARTTGAFCKDDSDCKTGGCNEELCYNPTFGTISTLCNCEPQRELSCGCVNNACSWWY